MNNKWGSMTPYDDWISNSEFQLAILMPRDDESSREPFNYLDAMNPRFIYRLINNWIIIRTNSKFEYSRADESISIVRLGWVLSLSLFLSAWSRMRDRGENLFLGSIKAKAPADDLTNINLGCVLFAQALSIPVLKIDDGITQTLERTVNSETF